MSKLPNEVPTPAAFGLLTAFLASNGFNPAWILANVGNNPSGRDWLTIAQAWRAGAKILPKA